MCKKILFLSTSGFAICFLFLVQTSMNSCTKDDVRTDTVTTVRTDTVTVIQKDTVVEKDTLLTRAILTANAWKIQNVRALYGINYIYYVRGGTSNTQSFDNEYIQFNTDGTGVYVADNGDQTSLTWNFTDSSYTKLVWNWNLPQPVVVTWENIVYNNASISYREFYTQFGYNTLNGAIRIPK